MATDDDLNAKGIADTGVDTALTADSEQKSNREICFIKLGAKGTWFVKWNDGCTASQGLPPQLHAKIHKRSKKLPEIISLAISSENQWLVIFADGSFSSSILQMSEKLKNSLMAISEPSLFVFAPFGGWFLLRKDGSMSWERLPTGLDQLLSSRTSSDPAIKHVTINSVGGWLAQFESNNYIFGGIPERLENFLYSKLQKKTSNLIVELSLSESSHYFIQSGVDLEWINGTEDLQSVLKFALGDGDAIPADCVFELNSLSRASSNVLIQ